MNSANYTQTPTFKNEQRELVLKLASNLDVQLDVESSAASSALNHAQNEEDTSTKVEDHEVTAKEDHERTPTKEESSRNRATEEPAKEKQVPPPAAEAQTGGVSSARGKFEQQPQDTKPKKTERRTSIDNGRKPSPVPTRAGAGSPSGSAECDISDPKIVEAYEDVRNDNSESNWLMLGYGSSKKALQLYGNGEGGLQEFVEKLVDNEVVYGYVRMKYGDSARSKFVFITYVPESLSGMSKAKANMHKPSVDSFLKYHHVVVNATTTSDLQEATIQAKLAAAAGANYGTGGAAPAGSENFGNIKTNAKSFFHETEKKGTVSISYNKDPLSRETPVNLSGRAGITEKYIST